VFTLELISGALGVGPLEDRVGDELGVVPHGAVSAVAKRDEAGLHRQLVAAPGNDSRYAGLWANAPSETRPELNVGPTSLRRER